MALSFRNYIEAICFICPLTGFGYFYMSHNAVKTLPAWTSVQGSEGQTEIGQLEPRTLSEMASMKSYSRNVYSDRLAHLRRYCDKHQGENFTMQESQNTNVSWFYSKEYNFLFCLNRKVRCNFTIVHDICDLQSVSEQNA